MTTTRRRWSGPGARGALAGAVLVTIAVLAAVRWDDLRSALTELAGASVAWVALAVLVNVASSTIRGLAWALILRRSVPAAPSTTWIVITFHVGQLGNLLMPARLGEAGKVALLARRIPDQPVAPLAGSIIAHRLLDVIPMIVIAGLVLLTVGVPGGLGLEITVVLAAGAALLGAAIALRPSSPARADLGRLGRLIAEGRQGLAVLGMPGLGALALGIQSIGWALEVVGAWTLFQALGIEAGWEGAVLVVLATSVVMAVPLWPGNVGVFQAVLAAALAPVGVGAAVGIAYGVALQAVEVLAAALPGLSALAAEGLGLRGLRRAHRSDGPLARRLRGRPRGDEAP